MRKFQVTIQFEMNDEFAALVDMADGIDADRGDQQASGDVGLG